MVNLTLLAVLGLIQVVFLPGYLLLRVMRIGGGTVATATLSFALSQLANFFLVAALVVLGLYRPAVVYAIFAAEVTLWLWLDHRRLKGRLDEACAAANERTLRFFRDIDGQCPIESRLLRRPMIGAAVTLIGGFALAGLAETGRIFQQWDAVVSWNRWAVDWAANRLPQVTSYYPQLLPANISLSYVFMQTSEVWIFAKAVQFLFCLMLLLSMLDAARHGRGNFGLVPGVAISYGLFVALLRYRMLSSGYADMPLAFFAWMPIYALIRAGGAVDGAQRLKWLLIGALLAAGAALTKQMGLYVAAIYPLLAWAWSPLLPFVPPPPLRIPTFLRSCLLIALLVAPWYAYKFIEIQSGRDENNTPKLLRDFHEGRTVPQRIVHAGATVLEATTLPGGALLLIAVAASLRDRRCRLLVGLFVVPLGLLWAAAFSYDLRNLAMLVPFVGMAAGFGVVQIVCLVERLARRVREAKPVRDGALRTEREDSCDRYPAIERFRETHHSCDRSVLHAPYGLATIRVWHAAGLLMVLTSIAVLCVRDETLLAAQRRQQRHVGIVSLNNQLYAIAVPQHGNALIASDYLALRWLPGLASQSIACTFDDQAAFRQTFDRTDVRYVLVRTDGAAAEVRAFLARTYGLRLLFQDHGYAFYEKLRPSA